MRRSRHRSRDRDPKTSAYLYFTLHELAAGCSIGTLAFSYFAWTHGEDFYWALSALCAIGLPGSVLLARRTIA